VSPYAEHWPFVIEHYKHAVTIYHHMLSVRNQCVAVCSEYANRAVHTLSLKFNKNYFGTKKMREFKIHVYDILKVFLKEQNLLLADLKDLSR
jgi:hypothetical protein